MYRLLPRKYNSIDEAKSHLEKHGKLEFFGIVGAATHVYNFYRNDGRTYGLLIDMSGEIMIDERIYASNSSRLH